MSFHNLSLPPIIPDYSKCYHLATCIVFFLLVLIIPLAAFASGDIIWNTEVTTTTINASNYASPPTDSFTEDGVAVTVDYFFPDYPEPGTYTGSSIPRNTYFVTTSNTVGNEAGILGKGMKANGGECIRTVFTFAPAVAGLSFPLLDIDTGGSTSWRDIFLVRATYQGTQVSGTGTIVDSSPTVQAGSPSGTDYDCTDIQTDFGNGLCFTGITTNAGNTTTRGNVAFNFPNFVDRLEVSYCEANNRDSSMLAAFGDFSWGYDIDDGFDFGDAAGYGDAWHSTPRITYLETLKVENVDMNWQSVAFENTYTLPPVVVCSYNLPTSGDPEAVVRINNLTTTGFEVRVQRPQPPRGTAGDPTTSDVFCLVIEQGSHTLPDGRVFEAHKVTSTDTSGFGSWSGTGENVTGAIFNTYVSPVVLGQVLTYNDSSFSTFWSYDCTTPGTPPFLGTGNICVGKHVGEDTVTNRVDEDLGYIVVEAGSGSYKDIFYEANLGANSIRGVSNSPPYPYTGLSHTFDSGAVTMEAMNGNNGGWAVLFGTPFTANRVNLAIDEDTIRDTERSHIGEQVGYWLFTTSQQPFIGQTRGDVESGSQNTANADGDDNDGNDDEDGVTFSSPGGGSRAEIVATVQVVNNNGSPAYVCAWLDRWTDGGSGNAVLDGIFDTTDYDDDGQACKSVAASSGSSVDFTWTSTDNVQGYTYARFRVCSTVTECNSPTGSATDGEIEDYRIDFDFTPTAVTIGKVELTVTRIPEFLAELNVDRMTDAELLALLQAWDADTAAALSTGADRQVILDALQHYLDPDSDDQVAVFSWDTLEERGTIGFYVDRRQGEDAWTRINNDMLPGLINAPMGGEYRLADPGATNGAYQYQLIEQEARGTTRSYGPFDVELP